MKSGAAPRSLLVFRIGYFGDSVIALPALRHLRDTWPEAHITLLSNESDGQRVVARDLVSPDFVDEFLSYPRPNDICSAGALIRMAARLRNKKFDAAVYLAPRIRSRWQKSRDRFLFRLLGIRELIGLDVSPSVSATERESDFLLRCAGGAIRRPQPGDDLRLTQHERQMAGEWLKQQGLASALLMAIAPYPGMASKQWPLDRFVNVARAIHDRYDMHPLIVCGPGDADAANRFIAALGTGTATLGSLPPRALAALLARCKLFVGVDTGSMHLAAAAGVSCVVVSASIDAAGRWDPCGEGHRVFRTAVECEGCLLVTCPVGNLCINAIGEHEVIRAAVQVLERQA